MEAVPVVLERARGVASLRVGRERGMNVLRDLGQAGCARILFPAVARHATSEAVLVNTSGGLTGGDRFATTVVVEPDADALVTTQACERIYRSSGGVATVDTRLTVGAGARLAWLPQETILFDGSGLARTLHVEIELGATFLALEAVLLGRRASGEVLTNVAFRDSWRVRRDGRLVFADETALGGALADQLTLSSTLKGCVAFATVLLASPDAVSRLDAVRELPTNEACEVGLSAFDGLCVARILAQDGAALRSCLPPLLKALGCEPPRVWSL